MASPTWWLWVWVGSGSWWWTGKPGVLQSIGSQRVGHDWVTELNWSYWPGPRDRMRKVGKGSSLRSTTLLLQRSRETSNSIPALSCMGHWETEPGMGGDPSSKVPIPIRPLWCELTSAVASWPREEKVPVDGVVWGVSWLLLEASGNRSDDLKEAWWIQDGQGHLYPGWVPQVVGGGQSLFCPWTKCSFYHLNQ